MQNFNYKKLPIALTCIFILSILTSTAQTTATDSTTTDSTKFIKPLKQISPFTYEIHINDIRTANSIFLEHTSFKSLLNKYKLDEVNYLNTISLLEDTNDDLVADKSDLQSIVVDKDLQITNNDTYYKSQIKFTKRQRNTAYVIVAVSTLVTILVLTK